MIEHHMSRIVVVNDDPVQLEVTAAVLEKHGLHVGRFFSADAALDAMTRAHVPDLIVTDLHMPGIDGWKFCRLIRSPDFSHLAKVPVLVMSATFSGAEVESLTRELGADAFLPNPCPADTLLGYVHQLLSGTRPRVTPEILVVDDDDGVRHTLRETFEANGWRVHEATSAGEAARIFESRRPGVVILDHHLPDRAGADLLAVVRKPAASTVALVMTGDANPRLSVGLMRLGADGYVRKPFDPRHVLDLVHAAQRERSLLRVEDILEARTQELRASEARYRVLYDSIPEGVVIVDGSGRILESNPVLRSWLSEDARDQVGGRLADRVSSDHRSAFEEGLSRIWFEGRGELETVILGAGGRAVNVEATLRAFVFQGAPALLCVCRDVTEKNRADAERKALEGRVQHAQKLESLGVLAGGVAHDFNNLLVGILGNASLAAMDLQPGPTMESIRQIEVAARRAAELTAQILTYTGKARMAREVLDLNHLVRELAQLLDPALSKKADLGFDLNGAIPPMKGDPAQVRQVAMNLIMNASDSLEGTAGEIVVRTGSVEADRDYLRRGYLGEDAEAGRYVFLEVEDSGCGMDRRTLERMFDPFFTTKFAGRGLGLAATLGIVRGHGGAIHVSSAPGRGTVFRVLFPAELRTATRPEPEVADRPVQGRGVGTILVVDDEDSVRDVATSVLRRFGYGVVPASDGIEALEILDDPNRLVNAVLLDLSMPGMDGREVLEAISGRGHDIPVVLSSGYTEDVLVEELRGRGVVGFIRKPYAPNELVHKMQRVVDPRRTLVKAPVSAN